MYAKVAKILLWVFLAISVIICVFGFIFGFEKNAGVATDILLYWAYAMVAIGLLLIVCLGIYVAATNNPKSLLKTGAILLCAAAIVAIAYIVAPGTDAVGFTGTQPSHAVLKWTDAMLILTYASIVAAIIAMVVAAIMNAIRK